MRIFNRLCGFWHWLFKGSQQPHPTLFRLHSFWTVVALPITLSCLVWFFIFKSLNYPDLTLTKEGFDRAYEYFKIPLWIAALSLPFAGFYASHHRSVQTAAQIKRVDVQISVTESKNNFENSIKHREYFYSELKAIEEKASVVFRDKDELYSSIFTRNNFDFFSPWADDMKFLKVDYEGSRIEYGNYFSYATSLFNGIEEELKLGDFREASKFLSDLSSVFNLVAIDSIDLYKKVLFSYLSIGKIYPIAIVLNVYQTLLTVDHMLRSISLSRMNRGTDSDEDFAQYCADFYSNYYNMFNKPVFRTNGLGNAEEVIDIFEKDMANERIKECKETRWQRGFREFKS